MALIEPKRPFSLDGIDPSLDPKLEDGALHLRLSHVEQTDCARSVEIVLPDGEISARVRHPKGALPSGFTFSDQRMLRGRPQGPTDLMLTPFPSPLEGKIRVGDLVIEYSCPNEENCWQLQDGVRITLWTAANPAKPILSVNYLLITLRWEESG